MQFLSATLDEAKNALTLYAFLTIAAVTILSRTIPELRPQRLGGALGLFGLHLVLLLVTAALVATGYTEAARDARIVAHVLLVMAWVGVGGVFLFGVALPRTRLKLSRILQDLIIAVVTIAVTMSVLSRLGVSLAGLFATSAVLTAVIGLSLQDTLGNTIGGLALQADGSVQVGDWIKVGDVNGRVVEIRWRYTAVETRNWETVLLPNSVLVKGPVTVLGRRQGQPEQWRRWVYFNVDFRYLPPDVIGAVTRAVRGQHLEGVASEPAPDCVLMDLHDSYGRYAVRYHLTNLAIDDPTDSLVRTRIMFALKRAGIPLSIPAHALFVTEESRTRQEAKSERDLRQRIEALRKVDLFRPLDEDELLNLARSLNLAPFSKGEIITRQGAEAHWLYLLVSGEVSIRVSHEGVEQEIATVSGGGVFGEMSLMTGETRSATVLAATDVTCFRLDKVAFQELVTRRPEIAEPIAALLAERKARRESAEENLGAEARIRKKREVEGDMLQRMKSFFGIDD